MIRIGVIGYGYWGPNVVRNFYEAAEYTQVVGVSDVRPNRLEIVRRRYPGVSVTPDHRELIEDPRVDAVALATPVRTHFDLAMLALRAGKHVWVEKPITEKVEQARQLIAEAARRKLCLHVDHTFVYTGAVRKMHEIVRSDGLGQIYYYDSVRVNLGLFQHDVNVIWDLAVHDLSILDYVLPHRPVALSATGVAHVPGKPEDVAFLTLFFDGDMIAHIHSNWLSPVKIRKTLVGGSKKMLVYDELEPSEKIKVYDSGIILDRTSDSFYDVLVGYRTGDMWAPRVDTTEALRTEVIHFAESILSGRPTLTDGEAGLRVVEILETATQSMRERGRPFELPHKGWI